MAEKPGFDHKRRSAAAAIVNNRDLSPESVVFTGESTFSSSVGRCSFASSSSDDALVLDSDLSTHLAGLEVPSGHDSDPNKSKVYMKSSHLPKKAEKVKAQKSNDYLKEAYSHNEAVDSARSSFSQALKECQDRRSKSDTHFRKQDRRRPASLDLNNHHVTAATSPRFGVMKKGIVTSSNTRRTGNILSPETPNYRNNNVTNQKGWSSERVPLRNNANRRNTNASIFFPFNNGRTLPSKWEDAERWIISPNAADGVVRDSFQQQQRRPKAKSGPLGPPGFAYNNSLNSPIVPMLEGGSPFSARVMVPDGFSVRSSLSNSRANGIFMEPYMARSVSMHGCTEMISQSTQHQGYQAEIIDSDKDASTNISRVISRRDMATQMSPEGSSQSSPISRLSFSLTTPSALPIVDFEGIYSSISDVRDVQVDERVTVTRWSKKNKGRFQGKVSENLNEWRKKSVETQSSVWEVSEAEKSISKIKRDEANISAWENLQKAKAEAAIRKLEMKLEKKRSSSMDKIMNKLRLAQKKAQEMRSLISTNQSRQVSKTSFKALSFRPTLQITSLSSCFTCHTF